MASRVVAKLDLADIWWQTLAASPLVMKGQVAEAGVEDLDSWRCEKGKV